MENPRLSFLRDNTTHQKGRRKAQVMTPETKLARGCLISFEMKESSQALLNSVGEFEKQAIIPCCLASKITTSSG